MILEQVDTKLPSHKCLFVVTESCPGGPNDGCCEFCPERSCHDQSIAMVDAECGTFKKLSWIEAHKLYKYVVGRNDRIKYYYAKQSMEGR